MPPPSSRNDSLAALFLVALTLSLYHKVLRLWWTYDDANILRTIFDYRFLDPFVNSKVWPQQLFTPLMIVAFDGQLKLFGMDPPHWYAMQLAIMSITAIAVYAAVRQFLDVGRSLAAAALFVCGVPVCSVVTQLSTVHYLLATLFSALATIAYVSAMRRSSRLANVFSVLFYLAAMLAKEVAIPLPLLLIALPVRDARRRLGYAVGHGLAAIGYFCWRYAVLGTLLGAYGWKIERSEWPQLLARLPLRIAGAAAGPGLWIGGAMLLFMMLIVASGIRNRQNLLLLLVAAIVVLAPLLPLAKEVNRRYVVVPWLAWSIACVAATSRWNRRHAAVALTVIPLLAITTNRQEWRDEFSARLRMSDEAKFFYFDIPADGLLRHPASPPAVMGELQWLKSVHAGRAAGASWFYDDIFLCTGGASGKRVWEYVPVSRAIVEITPKIAAITARHCGSIRSNAPLSVAFRYDKPALHWDLGPYPDGRYSAVIGNGIQAFELPPHDALNLPATSVSLRLRYDSPTGWTTYSPELSMDFATQHQLRWKR